jgi:hypothetical protein
MLKTAAVIRTTFTSNARHDPNFRDYLRGLKAQKITKNTWDIPFAREADIDIILNTLKEDFGYPIQILEILESPEISTDGKRYEMYARACVQKIRMVEKVKVERSFPNLHLASKFSDLVASLKEKKVKGNLEVLSSAAQNLKVARQFVFATPEDMYQINSTMGVQPLPGEECPVPGVSSQGTLEDNGIITICLDSETLKKLLLGLQQLSTGPAEPPTSFEYVPMSSEENEVLVPADVMENPQSDVGGLRSGIEQGPLESNILQQKLVNTHL